MGRLEKVMNSFDSDVIFNVVSGAAMVASVKESKCMSSMVDHLIGGGVVDRIDQAIDHIKTYIETLVSALEALCDKIMSSAWSSAKDTLNKIMGGVSVIDVVFSPFKPLAKILTYKVTLPWFQLPRTKRSFG